ncbi:hypothetical protein LBMAG53_10680 [Planctomycetota bacterium]|nr:hypothetical protein LBMAG53_10680 [Planctomycetota bacterium]
MAVGLLVAALAAADAPPDHAPPFSLPALIARAELRHPGAAAASAVVEAAAARARAAAAWDNPELELTFGRARPRDDERSADHPFGLRATQRLPWPGVRQARVAAARSLVDQSSAAAAVFRLELSAQVRWAAISLATARLGAAQAAIEASVAEELHAAAGRAAAAGAVDQATVHRVRLEVLTARTRQAAAQRAVDRALTGLRLLCGDELPADLTLAETVSLEPQALTAAGTTLLEHPRQAALNAAIAWADRAIDAKRLARRPSLALGLSADRDRENDTVMLSVGLDLPLWDRNPGGIAAAAADRRRAVAELAAWDLERRQVIAEAIGAYATAQAEAAALARESQPLAEEIVHLRTAAFATGAIALTEVLEARRAALAVQAALLDARRRAAEALVRLGLARGGWEGLP